MKSLPSSTDVGALLPALAKVLRRGCLGSDKACFLSPLLLTIIVDADVLRCFVHSKYMISVILYSSFNAV